MAIVKTDAAHFVKDTSTGALLNTDEAGYRAHLERRSARIAEKQSQEQRLQTLENNVAQILNLLRELKS
jgi:hypothetical protein